MKKKSLVRGYFVLYLLIAMSVFLFILGDLISSIGIERLAGTNAVEREQAFAAADAGFDYYRWHLAHFPGDLQDGTNQSGPYTHDVIDPLSSDDEGTFSLALSGVTSCNVLTSATITSTGVATGSPRSVILKGVFGKPTMAASTSPALSDQTRLTADLTTLKSYAQANGDYIAHSPSGDYGYQVTMNGNGTMSVTPVTGVTQVWGFSNEDAWKQENSVIASLGSATQYSIPANCPVVFIEDNVWLQGTVSGKVTLAAADLVDTGVDSDLIIPGNITYAHNDYTDGLTAIGEHSVLIALNSPDVMTLQGVFVADKGHFGRNRYTTNGVHAVPGAYSSDITRTSIAIDGTYASPGSVTLKWTDSNGAFISGYSTETDAHDGLLGENPPPFTPETADDFRLLDWRIQN